MSPMTWIAQLLSSWNIANYADIRSPWVVEGNVDALGIVETIGLTLCRKSLIQNFLICSNLAAKAKPDIGLEKSLGFLESRCTMHSFKDTIFTSESAVRGPEKNVFGNQPPYH